MRPILCSSFIPQHDLSSNCSNLVPLLTLSEELCQGGFGGLNELFCLATCILTSFQNPTLPEPSMAKISLYRSHINSFSTDGFHILVNLTVYYRHHCLATEGSQIPHLFFIVGVTLAIHKGSGTDTLMTGYTAWPAVHSFTFKFLHGFQENVFQSW